MKSDCKDCGRPDPAAKPPPIRVGVEGFEGTLFSEAQPMRPPIHPDRLAGLPAFEMFAAERGAKLLHGRRVESLSANGSARSLARDPAVVDEYVRWHAEKGLWPLETPWGELKRGA